MCASFNTTEDAGIIVARGLEAIKLLLTERPDCTLVTGSPEYAQVQQGFWAKDQADATPFCIFQPNNAQDISIALRILQQTQCPFAVKSGGHGRSQGDSSISAGILIDLKRLDNLELAEDKTSCNIGPGNTWLRVYSYLNPIGLTVVGGRASSVGVGGFVLSGGISFYSNSYGWALDNVLSFEVVLADGRVIQASPTSYPDLYKGLRGGCANFGVVTNMKLSVYPYKGMWGGSKCWRWDQADNLIDAFFNYGHDNVNNRDTSVILAVRCHEGEWVWYAAVDYLQPVSPKRHPIFQPFEKVKPVLDTTRITSQIQRIEDIGSHFPHGICNAFWTFCTQVDRRILKFYTEVWREEANKILDIDGIDQSALADCQFVTQNIVDAMHRNGGNSLGIAMNGPFLMMLIQPWWTERSQSHRVWAALRNTTTRVKAEAKRLGLDHNYIYMNYACQAQDVYAGYGAEAKEFLHGVSKKYDPKGVFQHLRKAGFHLQGPMVPSAGPML